MPNEDKVVEAEKLLPREGAGQEREKGAEDEGEPVLNAVLNQTAQRTAVILEEITQKIIKNHR